MNDLSEVCRLLKRISMQLFIIIIGMGLIIGKLT